VDTEAGEWWMVLLAMRPYGGYFYNLGRETFLVPVRWEDGWPVVSPGTGRVEFSYPVPDLPGKSWPATPDCDDFNLPELTLQWNFLRTPPEKFWSLSERPGFLRLRLRPECLSEQSTPVLLGAGSSILILLPTPPSSSPRRMNKNMRAWPLFRMNGSTFAWR